MKIRLHRFALSIVAVALLAACDGSQPPIGAPGTMPQSSAIASEQRVSPQSPLRAVSMQPRGNNGYKSLYSFSGPPDGSLPFGALLLINSTFYGTTGDGGNSSCNSGIGCGTVFSVDRHGREHVIYSFKGAPDAGFPDATGALTYVNGTLFGTTVLGGTHNQGAVFAVTPSGSERVLYSFKAGADGAGPRASLTALNGLLYGTTSGGGSAACNGGCGTVFSVTTAGVEQVLYRFQGYPHDGSQPIGSLIALKGLLYGTTWIGGGGCNTGCGTVFEVSTSGAEHVLHSFKGMPDGENPSGDLVAMNDKLYGTTVDGGTGSMCGSSGCGSFFRLSITGKERILYNFKAGRDSAFPNGDLLGLNGAFYGTANQGGAKCAPSGRCGTVFKLSTSGVEEVLYRFKGYPDGKYPTSGLSFQNGKLYGTTDVGGASNDGTAFNILP